MKSGGIADLKRSKRGFSILEDSDLLFKTIAYPVIMMQAIFKEKA
jgi:hypothetical protein